MNCLLGILLMIIGFIVLYRTFRSIFTPKNKGVSAEDAVRNSNVLTTHGNSKHGSRYNSGNRSRNTYSNTGYYPTDEIDSNHHISVDSNSSSFSSSKSSSSDINFNGYGGGSFGGGGASSSWASSSDSSSSHDSGGYDSGSDSRGGCD